MRPSLHVMAVLLALLSLPARAEAQQPRSFSLQHITELLRGAFATPEILQDVRGGCLAFAITTQNEQALRRAGADAALIRGLRGVRRCTTPPPPQALVLIEGDLPPGWSRSVNDGFVSTNRRIELSAGRPAVIVVGAPGWCPARTELTLRAGEEQRWTPELRARPWIGGCV
jgi:hypothetical protein